MNKTATIRNCNVIETAVKKGGSIRTAKRKLCLGRIRLHALNDKYCSVINNFNNIMRVAEDFYSELHSSHTSHPSSEESKFEQDKFRM